MALGVHRMIECFLPRRCSPLLAGRRSIRWTRWALAASLGCAWCAPRAAPAQQHAYRPASSLARPAPAMIAPARPATLPASRPLQAGGVRPLWERAPAWDQTRLLLQYRGGTGPVRQALGLGATVPYRLAPTGSASPPSTSREAASPPATELAAQDKPLAQRLLESLGRDYEDLVGRGVRLARAGRFREASLSFESAALIAPATDGPALASILCDASEGRYETAVVRLRAWSQLGRSPFRDELRPLLSTMAAQLSNVDRREQMERSTGAQGVGDVRALQALCVWHNGDRDTASLLLDALVRQSPESAFAGWASLARGGAP